MSRLTNLEEWQKLQNHFQNIKDIHLRRFFLDDYDRAQKFSLEEVGIYVDFSKNRMTQETLSLLVNLAEAVGLKQSIEDMFAGKKINISEDRAVLHTALRAPKDSHVRIDGVDVIPDVELELAKMAVFAHKIRSGEWIGDTGKPIVNIVNIGIGGSDLGPAMAYQSLIPYADPNLKIRFISNVDESQFIETVKDLNPEETLFIISSKTFTTIETMTNARSAKDWIINHFHDPNSVKQHFVAVSTNLPAIAEFGIDPQNSFQFWDWVGGRYSLCSAIGLSLMVGIGPDHFQQMLEGFHEMDKHFKNTSFFNNIPVILGLISVWYNNFFGAQTQAILPYNQYLEKLPRYLQQLEMESNGKSVDASGKRVDYQTAPIIWGEPGTNGQHAFYQLLHQGTKLIPSDFIGFVHPVNVLGDHHQILLSSMLAQTQALAFGKTADELRVEGVPEKIIPFKTMLGNQPSNTIMSEKLTPKTLGKIIALYEHKAFVEGVIWNIDSFDQWGVELGKVIATNILNNLNDPTQIANYDSSTNRLFAYIEKGRSS